ncbi:MAG: hypothetical protein ACKOPO_14715 [Novosphingobium sp.]
MKKNRKVLVRNVVLAMVAVDAAGIYYIHDRLSQPAPGGDLTIDDETIAAAAQVHFKPQVAEAETVLAKRELPKPSFGQQSPALASAQAPTAAVPLSQTAPTAHNVASNQTLAAAQPVKIAPATPAAKPAPAAKPTVLAKASAPAARPAPAARVAPAAKPAAAPVLAARMQSIPHITFAPAATPKAKAASAAPSVARSRPALAIAVPAARKPAGPAPTVTAPAKRAALLSVAPASTPRLARANTLSSTPVRKRASFRKAFASLAQTGAAPVLTTASGSLRNAAPVVKAQFTSEAHEAPQASLGITSQAMSISQPAAMNDIAPAKDPVAPTQPAATSSELPPVDE